MTAHAILTPEAHRDLRVRLDRGATLGDAVMSVMAMPDEFRRLQNEYPILFRKPPGQDGFAAVALCGFEPDENLFLECDRWNARYLPMAIDIQPFLIGRVPGDPDKAQIHVDLDSPRLIAEEDAATAGECVFDAQGLPTPYLEAVGRKLVALDSAYRRSAGFFAAIDRHDLLEPFALDVTLDDGTTHRLVGFHVIDEDRVRALDSAQLAELSAADHLLPIFMAMASLSNLDALVTRKSRRQRG